MQSTPDNYVITGDLQFPFNGKPAQTCAWFKATSITGSDDYRAGVSEDHIASVTFNNTIWARATVVGYSKNGIIIDVPYMESGWSLLLSFIVS